MGVFSIEFSSQFVFLLVFPLDELLTHLCLGLWGSFCPWKELTNIFLLSFLV